MDSIDRRIVALLQGNARLTYQQLGDGIGLSAAAAFQRVRRLEQAGVITGYHARIAPGTGASLLALLRIEPSSGAEPSRFLEAWERVGDVEAVYRLASGALLAWVRAGRVKDLEPYAAAARAAGCGVRVDVVSTTLIERRVLWTSPGGGEESATTPARDARAG